MPTTLCQLHRDACRRLDTAIAIRFRRDGVYQDLSWHDYRQAADCAAAGLISLGLSPGDRVAILSENRLEWLLADHAMLSAAAVTVPLHAPLSAAQVCFQLGHSGARAVFVSDQNQADKVTQVLADLPDLRWLIHFDPIKAAGCVETLSWNQLADRASPTDHETIARREAELRGDSLATIIYTSGTTGDPKGVMLSHDNVLSNALGTATAAEFGPDDVVLSWLPYSHVYARTVDHYLSTQLGSTLVLAESLDTLLDDLAEIQPTWMNGVPRFYEKVWAKVESLSPDDRRQALHSIFGPRIKQLSSGGAPLPGHVCRGFNEAEIPLLEGYGLTESSPVISFNSRARYRLGSVGPAIEGVEIRIASDGEILTRGPHVMQGYWKNEAATAEVIVEGWLKTGDVGELDADGFLSITDRKKDLMITSTGKNIAPSQIERLLASVPDIDQAVLYGDGRSYLTALVVPNFERLAQLDHEIQSTDGIISTPTIIAHYQQRIDDLMQSVSGSEQVKKFLLLDRPLQMANEELTATQKVRRRFVTAKYEAQLAALYD
jgi:long-chain acyl-CoA synthetase